MMTGSQPLTAASAMHGASPGSQSNDLALAQDSVRLVYRQTSAALMGHFLGCLVITLVYWNHAPRAWLWGWSASFALLWVVRFINLLGHDQAIRQGPIDANRWLSR